jgi:hypothetical protein
MTRLKKIFPNLPILCSNPPFSLLLAIGRNLETLQRQSLLTPLIAQLVASLLALVITPLILVVLNQQSKSSS